MKALKIAQNINFQIIALTEALELISKDTGISYESLIAQLPTNIKLQKRAAEFVVTAAKHLAEEL